MVMTGLPCPPPHSAEGATRVADDDGGREQLRPVPLRSGWRRSRMPCIVCGRRHVGRAPRLVDFEEATRARPTRARTSPTPNCGIALCPRRDSEIGTASVFKEGALDPRQILHTTISSITLRLRHTTIRTQHSCTDPAAPQGAVVGLLTYSPTCLLTYKTGLRSEIYS